MTIQYWKVTKERDEKITRTFDRQQRKCQDCGVHNPYSLELRKECVNCHSSNFVYEPTGSTGSYNYWIIYFQETAFPNNSNQYEVYNSSDRLLNIENGKQVWFKYDPDWDKRPTPIYDPLLIKKLENGERPQSKKSNLNMTQKITEEVFQNMITRPYRGNCKGTPVRQGKAEDGHKDCGYCEGNYYVGGECNFGGRHKLSDDLKQINKNFEVFDVLASQQRNLSKSANETEFNDKKKQLVDNFKLLRTSCQNNGKNFIYGGCIGIDQDKATFQQHVKDKLKDLSSQVQKYIERVEKATFEELQDFQNNWNQVENLSKESTKLADDFKNEKDKSKQKQILLLIHQKQTEQSNLEQQIKNSSGYALFSAEIGDNLNDMWKSLTDPDPRNKPDLFRRKKTKNESVKNPEQRKITNATKTWFSAETKESLKKVGLFAVTLMVLGVTYWWISSKLKGK